LAKHISRGAVTAVNASHFSVTIRDTQRSWYLFNYWWRQELKWWGHSFLSYCQLLFSWTKRKW